MTEARTNALLGQLLIHHYRSLSMFLTEAAPWTHRGDQNATEVLLDIVAGQKEMRGRIAAELSRRGCSIDTGEYEMDYLDLHFLALDFLLQRLIEVQQQEIISIGQIATQLEDDPPAFVLAKEALGAAKGYLQSLEELLPKISVEA